MTTKAQPIRRRRKLTAKETAKRLGISRRTVVSMVSEAREDYEGRATERKATAGTMRAAGHSWAEIAAAVDGTEWAARALVRRWLVEKDALPPSHYAREKPTSCEDQEQGRQGLGADKSAPEKRPRP